MTTTDPKNQSETPPTSEEPRPRRPYTPPAIEQVRTQEIVTLGTGGPKPKNPAFGC